jgi:hypothetical protein
VIHRSARLRDRQVRWNADRMGKRGVEGSSGALERGPYGERHEDCTNYANHLLSKMN